MKRFFLIFYIDHVHLRYSNYMTKITTIVCLLALYSCQEKKEPAAVPEAKHEDSAVYLPEHANDFAMKTYEIDPDSVLVEHTARFGKHKYEGEQYKMQDAVFFKLKITNKGNKPIPEIQTARKNGLRIWVNGNSEVMMMTLANFASGHDQIILKDSSDTWEMDFEITGPQPADFGNPFTFQWTYMGISSDILEADIKKRTIKKVSQHRPDHFSNQ